EQSIVLLALPAQTIPIFLKNVQREVSSNNVKPAFVNLSSLVDTNNLQKEFPDFQIYGIKMVGHANYLYEHGDGIFLNETSIETKEFQDIRYLFEKIGRIFQENENIVKEINGLAIRNIIEACVKFEEEAKNYSSIYREKAMDTIFPNTMKLYREGSFDDFMLKVMEEMNLKYRE